MNTKWLGLWEQDRKGVYAGQVIKKGDIPKYTRIVLQRNKFYEKDGNRPRFIYCFVDSEGYESKCVEMESERSIRESINRLAEILEEANYNAGRAVMPSESVGRAKELFDEAVSIIEDMTGQKWNFTYLSY